MHGRGRGRGRGQVLAADRLLQLVHLSSADRVLAPVLPYQEIPIQERYQADGEHFFNDEDHRRAARMLGLILSLRVATVDRPLWSLEIVEIMGALQVFEPALSDVLHQANRIPPEYTDNVLVFRRLDAHSRVFYHRDRR